MSFLRHEEIYRSDVGLGEAGNGNGCCRSQRSSAAMSFQSAIPWQGALQQSLPPLHRLETILNNQCCRTMIFQRTATTPLIPCLSPRVHFKFPFSSAYPGFELNPVPQGLKPQELGEPVTARLEGVPLQSTISSQSEISNGSPRGAPMNGIKTA